jgi:hypothetical protein
MEDMGKLKLMVNERVLSGVNLMNVSCCLYEHVSDAL